MIRKITLIVSFTGGYVLGAKAGTARYDQIRGQARALSEQVRREARPSPASTVGPGSQQHQPGDGASGRASAPARAGGGAPSSLVPGGPATSAQPPVTPVEDEPVVERSIDEMTELELELATAPVPPGGTSPGS